MNVLIAGNNEYKCKMLPNMTSAVLPRFGKHYRKTWTDTPISLSKTFPHRNGVLKTFPEVLSYRMEKKINVAVIGGGVVGLSTALCIAESVPSSVGVTLISEKFSPETTSDGSGGFWEPHVLGNTPLHLQRQWSDSTFYHLLDLLRGESAGEIGVGLLSGFFWMDDYREDPYWSKTVFGFRHLSPQELSFYPKAKHGWFYTTIKVETSMYLRWLLKRFESRNGKVLKKKIKTLEELAYDFDVAVICTGLGARELVGDADVVPVRGQLIKVSAPWIKNFYGIGNNIYIFPGLNEVKLGGTHQTGDWNTDVDLQDGKFIFKSCCELNPSLKHAEIKGQWAGLRPSRSAGIRLEKEEKVFDGKLLKIVYNYGHGGGGITTHWGCAKEAAKLVANSIGGTSVVSKL
ncbi:D-aspartate oxidase isoform X2 [Lingula anatina]|uniref:D-aspartate oxidase isoform X2 n=1 Tax=Lingula anatina TaxID=7574 RepID=A0A1S3JHB8_LINAN|nr:D-aspartate oxidase isoform X2 [Lingula anatina]|eukprot:XP_013409753.1 D-aspartate oxidase isoform X2 [Lingula anatina]